MTALASGLPSDKWGQGWLCHGVLWKIYAKSPTERNSAQEHHVHLFGFGFFYKPQYPTHPMTVCHSPGGFQVLLTF